MNTRTKQLSKLLSKPATRPSLGATASRDAAPQAGLLAGSLAATPRVGWREAIEATVAGLGFDLVDIERAPRGMLRIYIDRRSGHVYAAGESEFVQVADCEQVTRQLQYVLEVEGLDYSRLEVSSPGLDRPLRVEADFQRFVGHEVSLTFKLPFQGRKNFKGVLQGEPGAWSLRIAASKPERKGKGKLKATAQVAQQLDFTFSELKEARLVPVVDFKGRRGQMMDLAAAVDTDADTDANTDADSAAQPAVHGGQVR